MPSSYVKAIPPIVGEIISSGARKIVDVGPGWSKYGLLCREYLPDLEVLDAVEVREGRRRIQDAVYDEIFTKDVRDVGADFWRIYDLVLLIDVIEHLHKREGLRLLADVRQAGTAIIVSTPKIFFDQQDERNPHEAHLCLWVWEDFKLDTLIRDVSTEDSIIYHLGGDA